jgi:hypothetical protein
MNVIFPEQNTRATIGLIMEWNILKITGQIEKCILNQWAEIYYEERWLKYGEY